MAIELQYERHVGERLRLNPDERDVFEDGQGIPDVCGKFQWKQLESGFAYASVILVFHSDMMGVFLFNFLNAAHFQNRSNNRQREHRRISRIVNDKIQHVQRFERLPDSSTIGTVGMKVVFRSCVE